MEDTSNRHQLTSCGMWSKNEFGTLWNLAKGHAIPVAHESNKNEKRQIESAVSMVRAGLFGTASHLLLSSGLAPTKDTAAGPSSLRIQHLLDAATIPLPTSICSALRDVVNLMASGNVPSQVSSYLAGGCLTALNKVKPGCPPDIKPIAVGETLRRLTGKCLCGVIKDKASELFHPLQFGVACTAGSEKIIHGLRKCIEDHWDDEDFVVLKVDIRNAFNLVSRQAILDECASFFPELLPWVLWCYGTHSALWHPMGSDVRMCFSNCVATDILDVAWKQTQLGLSYGGLGMCLIKSHHSCAAYIASLSFSGLGSAENPHQVRSVVRYNDLVSWHLCGVYFRFPDPTENLVSEARRLFWACNCSCN